MIVSARVVAEGCSQKKKDPLDGSHAVVRCSGLRSHASSRGATARRCYAAGLSEPAMRSPRPHSALLSLTSWSMLLTARVVTTRPRRQRPCWSMVAGARADRPPRMTFSCMTFSVVHRSSARSSARRGVSSCSGLIGVLALPSASPKRSACALAASAALASSIERDAAPVLRRGQHRFGLSKHAIGSVDDLFQRVAGVANLDGVDGRDLRHQRV